MALQKIVFHYSNGMGELDCIEDGVDILYEKIQPLTLCNPCSVELDVLLETKEDCIELVKIANKIMSELEND